MIFEDNDPDDEPTDVGKNLAKAALAHDSKAVHHAMIELAKCHLGNKSAWFATHAAVHFQDGKALQLLIQHKVDINSKCCYRYTALHKAVKARCCHQLISLLLNLGADVDFRTRHRRTALHYACKYESKFDNEIVWPRLQIVRQLLAAGADPNPIDTDGDTPLSMAIQNNYGVIVRMLVLEHKVPLHNRALEITPLMHAVDYASPKWDGASTVQLLLSHRADTALKNWEGHTALTHGFGSDRRDNGAGLHLPALRLLLQGEFEMDPRIVADAALNHCVGDSNPARLVRGAVRRRKQWQRIALLTMSIRATRDVGTFRYSILPLVRSIMTLVGP